MYVQEDEKKCEYYKYLISIIKLPKGYHFSYDCLENFYNFFILKELNFNIKNGAYIMELDIYNYFKNNPLNLYKNKRFRYYKKYGDENLRCNLQNQIFEDRDRFPLTIRDIKFDLKQEYYLEDSSGFIYENNKPVGYGQLIMEGKDLYVVNFGIVKEFRGKNLGKALLHYLIIIAKKRKNPSLKLKVDVKNKNAINLYEKMGFKKNSVYFEWQKY